MFATESPVSTHRSLCGHCCCVLVAPVLVREAGWALVPVALWVLMPVALGAQELDEEPPRPLVPACWKAAAWGPALVGDGLIATSRGNFNPQSCSSAKNT